MKVRSAKKFRQKSPSPSSVSKNVFNADANKIKSASELLDVEIVSADSSQLAVSYTHLTLPTIA